MANDLSDEALKKMNISELTETYLEIIDYLVEINSQAGGAFVTISREVKLKIAALPENQRTGWALQIQAGDTPRNVTDSDGNINPTRVSFGEIATSWRKSMSAKTTRQFMTGFIKGYRDSGASVKIGYRLFKNKTNMIPAQCDFLLDTPKQTS